jgi:hypothetical protein
MSLEAAGNISLQVQIQQEKTRREIRPLTSAVSKQSKQTETYFKKGNKTITGNTSMHKNSFRNCIWFDSIHDRIP